MLLLKTCLFFVLVVFGLGDGLLKVAHGTRVYPFCGGDGRSIGFDMASSPWAADEAAFRRRKGAFTVDEASRFLEDHAYGYFTLDGTCATEWGSDRAESFARAIGSRVRPVFVEEGFLLAELTPSRGEKPADWAR